LQYRAECVTALNKTNTGSFTHLEWIGPIEDVNKMYQGTYVSSKPGITVRIKVSSTKPIVKNRIQLLMNGKPLTAADQVTVVDTGEGIPNNLTGEFEYEYKADVLLATGTSDINVTYDNKTVQPLKIKYN
jgi:hypothetical protein